MEKNIKEIKDNNMLLLDFINECCLKGDFANLSADEKMEIGKLSDYLVQISIEDKVDSVELLDTIEKSYFALTHLMSKKDGSFLDIQDSIKAMTILESAINMERLDLSSKITPMNIKDVKMDNHCICIDSVGTEGQGNIIFEGSNKRGDGIRERCFVFDDGTAVVALYNRLGEFEPCTPAYANVAFGLSQRGLGLSDGEFKVNGQTKCLTEKASEFVARFIKQKYSQEISFKQEASINKKQSNLKVQ